MNETKTRFFLIFISIAFLLLYTFYQFHTIDRTKELTIATGEIGSDSYAYGISYKTLLEAEDVKVKYPPHKGLFGYHKHTPLKKSGYWFCKQRGAEGQT